MKKIASALIRGMVWGYRCTLRPILHALNGGQGCCRFTPSCSQYMLEAVEKHGPFKGFYLGVRRLLRCHPWGDYGYDPVPPAHCKNHPHSQYSEDKTHTET